MNESDYLKVRVENLDREVHLLRRQVSGLQEDNERINRMYQIVEREATFTTGIRTQQQENVQLAGNLSSFRSGDERTTLRNGVPVAGGKWKVIEDDNFAVSTGNLSQGNQFYPTAATNNIIGQTTIRREDGAF